jgi:ATP-binding cassette subfamily C protein
LNRSTTEFFLYYLRRYPRRTALLVALIVLSGLSEGIGIIALLPLLEVSLGSPSATPSAISSVITGVLSRVGLSPRLEILLAIIVVGITLKASFRLLAMKQVGYTVARVTTDLRLALITALLETRWAYFISIPGGRFVNAISSEATQASNAYRNACTLLANAMQAIIYATLAVLVSWKVAVLAVLGGGAATWVLSRFIEMNRSAAHRQTQLMKSLTSRLADALSGIKPIKAMQRSNHLLGMLEHETREINEVQQQQVLAAEVLSTAQEPIVVLMLAGLLYGSLTLGNQSFSAVLVLAFVFYRLAGRMGEVQSNYLSVTTGESSFWSLKEAIDAALDQRERVAGGVRPSGLVAEIRLDGVSFRYSDRPVLERVSLTLPAGEFIALIGPSGAGKTTLADLVAGLYTPLEGEILIDGIPLREIDLAAWRRSIGYVPQEMFLFHDTVANNVTLRDPEIPAPAVEEALRAAGAWDFVAALPDGVDTVLGERGARLSGGQRQRVAIARALVRNPKLLILDEVTTALDPATEAALCRTLAGLKGRTTVLAISHQPAIVEVADRIYRVENGRVEGECITALPSVATA